MVQDIFGLTYVMGMVYAKDNQQQVTTMSQILTRQIDPINFF
jgi:hypothetical protein